MIGSGYTDTSFIRLGGEGIHNTNQAHQDWERTEFSPKITGEIICNAFVEIRISIKGPNLFIFFNLNLQWSLQECVN